MQASAASLDQLNSLTQEQFQGCANAAYPKLINNYASDSIDAGTIDIQSKLLVTYYSQFTIEKEHESILQFVLLP